MSISPQAMAALKKRIEALSQRVAAKASGPSGYAIVQCGPDGRLDASWGALPPGVGLAVIGIPSAKFLPAGPPSAWLPKPDTSDHDAALAAHLIAAAEAAAAGKSYPDFQAPPVAHRIELQDAPTMLESGIVRLPVEAAPAKAKANVLPMKSRLELAAERELAEFEKRFGM